MQFLKNILGRFSGKRNRKAERLETAPVQENFPVPLQLIGGPRLLRSISPRARKARATAAERARRKQSPRRERVIVDSEGYERIIPLAQRHKRQVQKARAVQRRIRRAARMA